MIPLQDILPRRNPPVMTWFLIIINFVIFFYEVSLSPHAREIFFRTWGFIPAGFFDNYFSVLTGEPWYQKYLTLLTHLFIHGSWFHIIGNMWTLWIFGDNVEDKFGHLNFLIFYSLRAALFTLSNLFDI